MITLFDVQAPFGKEKKNVQCSDNKEGGGGGGGVWGNRNEQSIRGGVWAPVAIVRVQYWAKAFMRDMNLLSLLLFSEGS